VQLQVTKALSELYMCWIVRTRSLLPAKIELYDCGLCVTALMAQQGPFPADICASLDNRMILLKTLSLASFHRRNYVAGIFDRIPVVFAKKVFLSCSAVASVV